MLGATAGDLRVQTLLDELGLRYKFVDCGQFQVRMALENGRKQAVYIASDTYRVDQVEIREVSSPGFKAEAAPHADIANALLAHNAELPIGAWRLHRLQHDEGCTAIFSIHIAANTTAATLRTAIQQVARAADTVEQHFTGEDKF